MLEQRKPETARNELTAYILRRGNSLESLLRLGSAQLRSRDFAGAEKTFSDSARLSPTNAESLNGLGMVRVYQRRPTEAGQFFNAALHHDPQYAPAILNLAVMSLNAQDRQSALRRLKEYASLTPHAENIDAVSATIQKSSQLAPVPMAASAPTPAPGSGEKRPVSILMSASGRNADYENASTATRQLPVRYAGQAEIDGPRGSRESIRPGSAGAAGPSGGRRDYCVPFRDQDRSSVFRSRVQPRVVAGDAAN